MLDLGKESEEDLNLTLEDQNKLEKAIKESLYLNSIPGFVESVKASDHEPIEDMEEYDPLTDTDW